MRLVTIVRFWREGTEVTASTVLSGVSGGCAKTCAVLKRREFSMHPALHELDMCLAVETGIHIRQSGVSCILASNVCVFGNFTFFRFR